MKDKARVVVIGGGVVGVSTLYHLARAGWSDVVLCERTELTAGSTWHAAGLLPLFNMSYTVGQIHKYSVDLYKSLEAETGQDVSFHVNGNLRLACNQERMDEYKKYCGTANTIGVPFRLITVEEIKSLWPPINEKGLVGALYHPDDGHIAPVDLTNALAKGARSFGAEIYQHTPVTDVTRTQSGEWRVVTEKGEITCEHIVLATGNYARQSGKQFFGLDVPAVPVEHQYIVTDEHPVLVERHKNNEPELAVLRESDESYYMREERKGLILGPYEKGAPARFLDGVDKGFEKDLFPGDLDRLMPHVEAAIRRVPMFEEVGIKDIVNGPISYTPDGSPLVGPAWGVPNVWLNEGHSFGVTAAGGSGHFLSQWMINGEPPIDMMAVDPRRFGAYVDREYLKEKNEECYAHVFIIHYPDEERPAARPKKTTPIHDRLEKHGAVFGQRYGWERANWFAPQGTEAKDVWSFRRTNYFPHVGDESKALRERVGLIDLTPFTKYFISGAGAEAWLDSLVANRVPRKIGRMALCHALTDGGGVRSEFTITRIGEESFYVVSSGAAERFDGDYLEKHLPASGVTLENRTLEMGTLVVAGPQSRELLQPLTDSDLSNAAFPWLSAQTIALGGHKDIHALRVNFVGELGWELHLPIDSLAPVFDAVVEAGKQYDIAQVGMRAMDVLRIEKSYRMWAQDLTTEYSILEAGLDRFVRLGKDGGFRGEAALEKQKAAGVPQGFVTLEVDIEQRGDRPLADPIGNEPLFSNGEMIGRATSGCYGHNVGKSLALGYVRAGLDTLGTELEIEVLRERFVARVIEESPWDPENERLRA